LRLGGLETSLKEAVLSWHSFDAAAAASTGFGREIAEAILRITTEILR
jgi:hypothetical protein